MSVKPQCYYSFHKSRGDIERLKNRLLNEILLTFKGYIDLPGRISNLKIIEVPVDYMKIRPYTVYPSIVRGYYDDKENTIFLALGNWCLKTIVHELIHPLSILYNDQFFRDTALKFYFCSFSSL